MNGIDQGMTSFHEVSVIYLQVNRRSSMKDNHWRWCFKKGDLLCLLSQNKAKALWKNRVAEEFLSLSLQRGCLTRYPTEVVQVSGVRSDRGRHDEHDEHDDGIRWRKGLRRQALWPNSETAELQDSSLDFFMMFDGFAWIPKLKAASSSWGPLVTPGNPWQPDGVLVGRLGETEEMLGPWTCHHSVNISIPVDLRTAMAGCILRQGLLPFEIGPIEEFHPMAFDHRISGLTASPMESCAEPAMFNWWQ